MKKNYLLKRLITLMSVLAFICSNVLSPNMMTFADISEDAQAAILNDQSSLEECAAEAFTPVNENDEYPSDFGKLFFTDGLPFNTIHLKVQKDIRAKNKGILKDNELYVKFSNNRESLNEGYKSWKDAMKGIGEENPKWR